MKKHNLLFVFEGQLTKHRYLQQLSKGTMRVGSGGAAPAHYQNRQNPYSWKLFGEIPYPPPTLPFDNGVCNVS